MRLANVVGLHLEHSFRSMRAGRDGPVHLVVAAAEVKNGEALEFELPPRTVRLLRDYVDHHRPHLVDGVDRGYLFPGRQHGHKSDVGLREQLQAAVKRHTGLVVNPHLYRHAAALFYLERHPGDYETVRRLLGHKSLETTVSVYADFERYAATRAYSEHILSAKDELDGRYGRRGRGGRRR